MIDESERLSPALQAEIEDNINRADGFGWDSSLNRLKVDSAISKHDRGEALRWLVGISDRAQSGEIALSPLNRVRLDRCLARGMGAAAKGEVDLTAVEQVRKRGARVRHAERDVKIGREIDRLHFDEGMTIELACAEVAPNLGLSEDRVKNIYDVFRKDLGNRLI